MHLKSKKIGITNLNPPEREILRELRRLQKEVAFMKKALIDMRDECAYPSEERLKRSFVEEAVAAEKRATGEGKAYTPEEFKAKYS